MFVFVQIKAAEVGLSATVGWRLYGATVHLRIETALAAIRRGPCPRMMEREEQNDAEETGAKEEEKPAKRERREREADEVERTGWTPWQASQSERRTFGCECECEFELACMRYLE